MGVTGGQVHAQLCNEELQYLWFVLRKDQGVTGEQ